MSLGQQSDAHTYVLFLVMQAIGMKLLRKKDVPDYKVPSLIWVERMFARFCNAERNSLKIVFIQF
jgi:hypothetical protein